MEPLQERCIRSHLQQEQLHIRNRHHQLKTNVLSACPTILGLCKLEQQRLAHIRKTRQRELELARSQQMLELEYHIRCRQVET